MNALPDDESWMREAIAEARRAEARGEVPVGAVIVHEGAIIARGHNERELSQDPTTHAGRLPVCWKAGASSTRPCTLRWSPARCAPVPW